jgi:serine/threonine-protein kinase
MKREERYEILETIQEGMLATSYKARDRVLDRLVLLKVLTPSSARDTDLVQRFRREAMLQARLKHPHIVTVYDFGEEKDFYIASEFIEGTTFEQVLAQKGRLTLDELRPLVLEVVGALSFAHQDGVVHRDLKPANIMVSTSGEAKLTDFGLAFARDFGQLTQEGCVIGTPAYMSPEQSRGKRTDVRTDVFSLGIVIYEALSGVNPFKADSYADSMSLVLNREPEPLDKLVPDLPPAVSRLVTKMLPKDVDQRLPDVDPVSTVFSPAALPAPARARRSRAVILPLGAVVLVLLAAAGAYFGFRGQRSAVSSQQSAVSRQPSAVSRQPSAESSQQSAVSSQPVTVLAARDSGRELRTPNPAAESVLHPPRSALVAQPPSPANDSALVIRHSPLVTQPATVHLQVNVDPWAEVLIDGASVGTTPIGERPALAPGRHEITLRNPHYPLVTKLVTLGSNDSAVTYDLNRECALVDIRVSPWALLSIDGRFIDTTPINHPIPLALGEHTVTLTHPQLGTKVEQIRTDSARAYQFTFDMTKS